MNDITRISRSPLSHGSEATFVPIAGRHRRPTCPYMANYDKRQDEDELWEVFDGDNDRVVSVDGLPLSGLDEDEADEAIRQLSRGEISPDTSPESP